MKDLDAVVRDAIDKHERLLHLKTLELLLGSMVRRSGIAEVRKVLMCYVDDLAAYDPTETFLPDKDWMNGDDWGKTG